MQSITNALSTASSFIRESLSSLPKRATIIELFSKVMHNQFVIAEAVTLAPITLCLCVAKRKKARVQKPKQPDPEPSIAVWKKKKPIDSIQRGQWLRLETNLKASYLFEFDGRMESSTKRAEVEWKTEKYVLLLSPDQLKKVNTIAFNIYHSESHNWVKGYNESLFEIKINNN